ncbi:HU family DNA-binding protein [Solitalea koreensis]|nr:HU family DNA-binding protein [Solitalea koreensis]
MSPREVPFVLIVPYLDCFCKHDCKKIYFDFYNCLKDITLQPQINEEVRNLKSKNKMTKAEVIAEIAQRTGIEKVDVAETVEAFFKVIKNSMIEGENVYVRGFGSFVVKKRAQKTARNISKNTAIIIPEHFIPSFKPAKVFVDKVKNSSAKAKLEKAAAENVEVE